MAFLACVDLEFVPCIISLSRQLPCFLTVRAVFDEGVGGLNPPRKFLTPLLLLKNARGVDFLCTYALARSSTSIAKTSTPLMKFHKYSPAHGVRQKIIGNELSHTLK